MRTSPPSEEWLADAFGTTRPRILGFPHCIFPVGVGASRLALTHLGATAGIFGSQWPLVDQGGEAFLPPEEDQRIIEAFSLWALPGNQMEVHRWCEGIDSLPIRWLIDAGTHPDLLHAMHDPWQDWEDFGFYIDRLADWIDDLGWALVPLEPEGEWVMLVLASTFSDSRDAFVDKLAEHAIEGFRLDGPRQDT